MLFINMVSLIPDYSNENVSKRKGLFANDVALIHNR